MNDLQQPLVSIIVITYNSSEFVRETLESAKEQTYQNIELIISDDCSTDNTVEVCKNWIEKNKSRFVRTEVITINKNSGVPANCNRGIYAAKGLWIKLIAGDDALIAGCVKDNIDFCLTNSNINIVQSECAIYNNSFNPENLIRKSNLFTNSFFKEETSADEQYKILLKRNCILASGIFIKKSLLAELGGYDEAFHLTEDYPMWLKITRNNVKFYFLNKITVKYRLSNSSVMKNKKPYITEKYAKEMLLFTKKYKKERKLGIIYHFCSLFGIYLIIFFNRIKINNNSRASLYLFKLASFFVYMGRRKYRTIIR